MKKFLLLAALLLMVSGLYSQRAGIKLYQNTDIFDITYNEFAAQPENTREVNFHRVSLALVLPAGNNFKHEFELFIPQITRPVNKVQYPMNYELRKGDTFSGEVSTLSIRYEFSKSFSDISNRFVFDAGVGLNPYYVFIEYFPDDAITYRVKNELYGAAINLIPRLSYKLSDQLAIDLNVPLKVYDLRWEKTRYYNPAIPIRDQKIPQDFEGIFFESAYTMRLGLMYTFKG